jgi:hypothetical protein
MSRRSKLPVIILVVIGVLAAAQLIRPDRTNPAIDPRQTIEASVGTANGLAAILERSCGDCHSNETVWPAYTQVAPLSWLMAYAVNAGRQSVNFSEWASYSPANQRSLLSASCRDASAGKMPGAYALVKPETRLTARDIETICTAARNIQVQSAGKNSKN